MKLNSSTRIVGRSVILVPYKKKHVPKYHKWMQSKELLEATASDPLSEEEEYAMQQTWFLDDDKCTFIVLDKNTYTSKKDEIESMIGDTNLYISKENELDVAECGIMIAEESKRGQGKGFEALVLMLKYGCESLNINKFVAKINLSNTKSICLFHKIGFKTIEENDVFAEATLTVIAAEEWKQWLNSTIYEYSIESYSE